MPFIQCGTEAAPLPSKSPRKIDFMYVESYGKQRARLSPGPLRDCSVYDPAYGLFVPPQFAPSSTVASFRSVEVSARL